ncbi:hypothetical protein RND81_04G157700 [Saponaria officinalis]|uniref:Phosphoinositide phospholipase C n=1 Tax=Saponaria officinalis TaxID=3572 RepID=A0AAW1LLR3_SAPOF
MSDAYDTICYFYRLWCKETQKETPPDDVQKLFRDLSNNEGKLSVNDLQEFLITNQGEQKESALETAETFKRSSTFSKKGLKIVDFLHFLLGKLNPALVEPMSEDDLNRPLPHYFVYTSHDSYLKEHKSTQAHHLSFPLSDLTSKNSTPLPTSNEEDYKMSSSVSAIKKALRRGVRVIELSLYPNSNNKKVQVQHKGASHSSVKLSKCLEAISQHAFHKSDFPVILVLVEHINKSLQDVVAAKIKKYLGGNICSPKEAFNDPLQSLKNKFIILSRQPKQEQATPNSSEVESSEKYQELIAGHIEDLDDQFVNLRDGEASSVRILSSTESLLENASCADIISFTKKNLLAVYPNHGQSDQGYDPFIGWIRGAQIVAFNTQSTQKSSRYLSDKCLRIMQGLFRAYGSIGYARKPNILLDNNLKFDPTVWRPIKKILKVKVYMGTGWHLDFSSDQFDETSRPDFFVALEVVGHPEDEAKEKTEPAIDQWIPTWDEEFEFTLTVPEIAMLLIEVKEFDIDRTHDFGGQTCLPVWLLKDGIRSVPLYKENGKPCKAARLLVRFQLT